MSVKAIITALGLLKNDKFRKKIGIVICIIISPFALIIALLVGITDGVAQHNNAVVQAVFGQEEIPDTMPLEYKIYIIAVQKAFTMIDEDVTIIQKKVEEGALDPVQVKSLFFAVYYGNENAEDLSEEKVNAFVDCFVTYKTITIPVETENKDEVGDNDESKGDGNEQPTTTTTTKEVATIIKDIDEIYKNISEITGTEIMLDQKSNYEKIYSLVNLGANASAEGDGSSMNILLKDVIEASESKPYVGGSPASPFEDDWRTKITSEFGARFPVTLPNGTVISDPHTGMDLGKDVRLGTPILSVNDGTVVYVRNHTQGLGLHLAVDHGGGIITVYGHTSRILVKEGEEVKKGQKIAEIGTTGWSTGAHLHLEYWTHGEVHNPREYLEK